MKCPFCGLIDDKVVDSRLNQEKNVVRRRRACVACSRRFTTYERIEDIPLMIIKKDERRERFSPKKVRSGIRKACEKRNVSMNIIETFIDDLEQDLKESDAKEMPSSIIGEKIMGWLHDLDAIAYVRFASVYREFKDANDFFDELKHILNEKTNRV
ncbi:transcriptional regulator NrdR [Desulfococcaceae bacterium HSG9]|nr:transcriptional regulator NrdR [Desulfococcaceae bacterium HSG9]